jgi:adenine deaminase
MGTGIKNGALAGSVSHDAHNIWTIGTDHAYMALAVNEVVEMGGGFAVIKNGEVISRMELPVGGLISEEPIEVVARKLEELEQVALIQELHCSMEEVPLFLLSAMSLPNIPEWGITDKGLVEVRTRALVNTVVE